MPGHRSVAAHARPFVKWAGGKRQLIPAIDRRIPGSFERYFEPFLGGGALLFHLLKCSTPAACHVSDINEELILAYAAIRDDVDGLVFALKRHAEEYDREPAGYYYRVRDSIPDDDVEKAARFMFLNRVCYNGLYRVNSKGRFNVPLGWYDNPRIVDGDNLLEVSRLLLSHKVRIGCSDFEAACRPAKKGDFVYFDPPYRPVTRSSFTRYSAQDFGLGDLERLIGLCRELDARGCYVMLSNSDMPDIADSFKDWQVERVSVSRAINSLGSKRRGHTELLITNYPAGPRRSQ